MHNAHFRHTTICIVLHFSALDCNAHFPLKTAFTLYVIHS